MSYIVDMTGCEVHDAIVNIIHYGPHILRERIGEEDGFAELRQITTTTAIAQEDISKSIISNSNLGLSKLQNHPEFQKSKGNIPIAIVGGGPSLEDSLNELRNFNYIFAAGSSHDYLIKNGYIPNYCAACDPDVAVNNYFKFKHKKVDYLIASACDPEVFKYLEGQSIYIWNCYSDGSKDWFLNNLPGDVLIGGGCTIGLRAINIAIMLGYTNIHLFGFDSCMKDGQHHSYGFENENEKLGIGNLYNIKIGRNGKKTYQVAGYQLAQADNFRTFLEHYSNLVSFTFHGEGLLRDVYDDFIQVNHLENRI